MKTTNPKDIKLYSVGEVCATGNHDGGSYAIIASQSSKLEDLVRTWVRVKLDDYPKDRWLSRFTAKVVMSVEPYEILTQPVKYCEHLHYIFLYKHPTSYGIHELELCIHETHPTETF